MITSIEKHAIARELGKEKPCISPGTYNIDKVVQLRIQGQLTKYESEEYIPTQKVPWRKLLAVALKKAGVQRENIRAVMSAALKDLDNCNEIIHDCEPEIDALMNQYIENMTKDIPKDIRDGKTVVDVKIEEI